MLPAQRTKRDIYFVHLLTCWVLLIVNRSLFAAIKHESPYHEDWSPRGWEESLSGNRVTREFAEQLSILGFDVHLLTLSQIEFGKFFATEVGDDHLLVGKG